jgi:hypothetical protein
LPNTVGVWPAGAMVVDRSDRKLINDWNNPDGNLPTAAGSCLALLLIDCEHEKS